MTDDDVAALIDVLSRRAARERRRSTAASSTRSRASSSIPSSCSASSATRRRRAPGAAYRISDLELASRLSFFLWSSIPDEELLDGRGERTAEGSRGARSSRCGGCSPIARSSALVSNFAAQWLQLRNIRAVTPDVNLFPEFDDNLRLAMQRETELFIESQIREDRSIGELLTANYTFLNERLARHYGIPGVLRQPLPPGDAMPTTAAAACSATAAS